MDMRLIARVVDRYDLVIISAVPLVTFGSRSCQELEYGIGETIAEAVWSFVNINELDIDDLLEGE